VTVVCDVTELYRQAEARLAEAWAAATNRAFVATTANALDVDLAVDTASQSGAAS
jgi:hypothetical protein